MERVTRKQSSKARQYVHELLDELHHSMKDKYRFTCKLVGSAAWNTILKDEDGMWDLDYQILLTSKSKEYKDNGLSNPTNIKLDFFNYFNDLYKDNSNVDVQNSTTAITIINKANKYSVDLVIIKLYPDNHEIIRRNNKDGSGVNEFTWNELPKFNEAYEKFNNLSPKAKKDLIENHILPRKEKEKAKPENDSTKISSSQAFVVEVNNYVSSGKNN